MLSAWKLRVPAKGTLDPLKLNFPSPLDRAQLWRGITVASASGQPISGRVDIGLGETRWRFTPDESWQVGAYSARVSPGLEDACGNTVYGPFDGPFRMTNDVALETTIRSMPFVVKAA